MRHIPRLCLIGVVGLLCGAVADGAQRDRQTGGIGMTVWEDTNYRGPNHTFIDDTPDLRSIGMDNQISSLRLASGQLWQVCDGYNYTGRCQVFSTEESDLRRREWNDLISSVRRLRGPGQGAIPPGPGPRGLELYAGMQYSGERVMLDEATPDLRKRNFSDRAMSVRVPRGEVWELCVNLNYDDCRIVDEDLRSRRDPDEPADHVRPAPARPVRRQRRRSGRYGPAAPRPVRARRLRGPRDHDRRIGTGAQIPGRSERQRARRRPMGTVRRAQVRRPVRDPHARRPRFEDPEFARSHCVGAAEVDGGRHTAEGKRQKRAPTCAPVPRLCRGYNWKFVLPQWASSAVGSAHEWHS